jgi:hypothetical protein
MMFPARRFCSHRVLPVALASIFVLALGSMAVAAEIDAVAFTTNFATNGGTDKNGFLLGQPVSATSVFNAATWPIPANDPEGTVEHELLHGIGFFEGYFNYADHLFNAPAGDAAALQALGGNGIRLFSSSTTDLEGVLGVTATFSSDKSPDRSHLADANFSTVDSTVMGITYPDQSCDLMTQAPRGGCALPYEQSAIDKTILGAAFGWGVNTALAVNVTFVGGWTGAQKTFVSNEVNEVVGGLNGQGEPSVFDWTVVITPEPGTYSLVPAGLLLLWMVRRRFPRSS